ncbi:28S ribosomal protein S30, mitochondrial-like isoform X1 [Amphibalanus amphitrite]|uniref:28S ribosomal protein S30, mitochondrial-like isoform X1 n=1 Tax=Amphibalanus amphitrite TaxID=1232801 RepID=UPI001C915D7B|nr:28S ribosomal protein S30, mitochondrial-like isoform X1 [Amphibalanus amphitrite]
MAASMAVTCRSSALRLNLLKKGINSRCFATTSSSNNVSDVKQAGETEAEYPPVLDTSFKATKDRETQQWHKLIQSLPTVQEKQLELNMSRYYGHWACQLSPHDVHYNHAEFIQFATRTNVVEAWPNVYSTLDDEVNKFLPVLKKKVEDIFLLELCHRPKVDRVESRQQKETSDNIIWAINHALVSLLSDQADHIADSQSDLSPRLEAFWWLSDVPADSRQRHVRSFRRHIPEEERNDPVSRPVQFVGQPALLVRGRLPLPALAGQGDPVGHQPPPLEMDSREPRTRQCAYKFRHGTNIPGVWPEDGRQFGLVNWLTREHLVRHATKYGQHAAADRPDALRAQACLSGFASCLSQACGVGFSPLTELTYPLTTQTVITDGRTWTFSAFQLNTTGALLTPAEHGAPGNTCWVLPEMQLYQNVTEKGVEGLNEEVLKRLLQLYLLPTGDRDGIELRPYLDPERSLVDAVEDDWLRTKYLQTYFHIMSCRPRSRLKDEVYMWEKIYKVQFQTRPMEARKRFFELNKYPDMRRLDDFYPGYIPRALRQNFVPARFKAASKHEKNVFHEMGRLRGHRNTDPKFLQELQELESWRDEKDK